MDSDLNFDGRKGGEPDDSVFVHAAGFLLAGGRSSRMGRDKALLTLGGEPLIKIGLEKLRVVCSEVAIAGGTEDLARFGRVVPDGRLDCGPLGGIVSSLEQSLFEWNLFLPVDTPFVPVTCLKSLLSMAAGSQGVCVMATAGGEPQPLCAVYSRKALEVLRRELDEGRWKITQAIEAAGVVKVVEFENAEWFANLNTPEEFAEAEQHLDALDT
jgi:molybdopterin-guanine dinucleotide biosynthesis protein A